MPGPAVGKTSGQEQEDRRLARLSPQEENVLGLVAAGHPNGEIGLQLGMAEKTATNSVPSILVKLEVGRRAEAAFYFVRHTADHDLPGPAGLGPASLLSRADRQARTHLTSC